MKLTSYVITALSCVAYVSAWNRLDKNNTVLLIVDHQVGLSQIVQDWSPNEFKNGVLAHAALGKLFNLPTILTSSTDTGPNGPLLKEITDMYPDAPFIRREGEVNAWDNAAFRDAVRATGKRQVIVGGIVTEVCTAFLSLSLVDEGYQVFANAEASGTFNDKTAEDANRRMEKAGVTILNNFAITMDLMRDWRQTPGMNEVLPYIDTYLWPYGLVAQSYMSAMNNDTHL
ncbi:hypothetical protein AJ79_05095 [Helicocarpus griseus UAMH5409]|uniref:Isochorismatase-like domain-containing protein n=1 Tax=Helicocarpus griseus UAMH5409 TaxID=1447875 RepID=A0A2B7XQL3_9EURO|nr:hypothetical protein AJ79_05095 [Helicocarpus griseus UAMH5409]